MPTQFGSFKDPFVQYAVKNTRPQWNQLSEFDQQFYGDLRNADATYNNVFGEMLYNQNVPLAIRQWMQKMQPEMLRRYQGEMGSNLNGPSYYEWLQKANMAPQYRELPSFQRGDKPANVFGSRFIQRF